MSARKKYVSLLDASVEYLPGFAGFFADGRYPDMKDRIANNVLRGSSSTTPLAKYAVPRSVNHPFTCESSANQITRISHWTFIWHHTEPKTEQCVINGFSRRNICANTLSLSHLSHIKMFSDKILLKVSWQCFDFTSEEFVIMVFCTCKVGFKTAAQLREGPQNLACEFDVCTLPLLNCVACPDWESLRPCLPFSTFLHQFQATSQEAIHENGKLCNQETENLLKREYLCWEQNKVNSELMWLQTTAQFSATRKLQKK